jgi:hypothetical protein
MPAKPAAGIVIEANLDKKKGIMATLIIKEGAFKAGQNMLSLAMPFRPCGLWKIFWVNQSRKPVFKPDSNYWLE